MKIRIFLAAALLAAFTTLSAASRLETIKGNVRFEIEQKERLLQANVKIADALKRIRRGHVTDEQILKVMALTDACTALQEMVQAANARQALHSEEIGRLLQDAALSAQENAEYRNSSLALAELARAQNKLAAQLADTQKYLADYLKRIPPPTKLALPCGLELTLVGMPGRGGAFYASAPVTQAFAAKYLPCILPAGQTPASTAASLSLNQARQLAKAFNAAEDFAIRLPTQTQLEAMANADIIPPLAVWSGDLFTMKNSLTHARQRLNNTDKATDKYTLSSQQSNAASRFKIPFYTFWDPAHKLGDVSFNRELADATYKDLGVLFVTSAKIGSAARLDAITEKYNQQKQAQKKD